MPIAARFLRPAVGVAHAQGVLCEWVRVNFVESCRCTTQTFLDNVDGSGPWHLDEELAHVHPTDFDRVQSRDL